MNHWKTRLSRLAWGVFLAALGTGLVVFSFGHGLPASVTWIRLHLALGWVACVGGFGALVHHVRHTGSPVGASLLAVVVGALAAIPAPYALILPEEAHDHGPVGAAWALLLGSDESGHRALGVLSLVFVMLAVALPTVVGLLSRTVERSASRRTGYGITVLVAWACASGIFLGWEPVARRVPAQTLHSVAGVGTAVVLVLHLTARWAAARRWHRVFVAVVGTVLVAAAFVAVPVRYRLARLDLPTLPWAPPATDEERARWLAGEPLAPHLDASAIGDSDSCGASGCHTAIHAEWAASPHASAGRNAAYRAAAGALVAEGRLDRALFCATCHDPVRVATGTLATDYRSGVPDAGDGVSCLYCHSIAGTRSDPPANGAAVLSVPRPYPGEGAERHDALRLDTRHHRDGFVFQEAIYGDDPCLVCHRVELAGHTLQAIDRVDVAPDGGEASCRLCHLPPSATHTYGHRMAGLHADSTFLVSGVGAADPHAEAVRRFTGIRPYVELAGEAWLRRTDWDPARPGGEGGAPLVLDVHARRIEGGIEVEAVLSNLGVGHAFPAGPFDLQEHWFELWVGDSVGATILHRGSLDPRQARGVAADPPDRLGAAELDRQGRPIEHHRIHDIVTVGPKAQVKPGGARTTRVFVTLPPGLVGPFSVRARWLHRRLNPQFSAWALGHDRPLPTWEIAGNHTVVP